MQLTRAEVCSVYDIECAIEAIAQQPNGASVVMPTALTALNRGSRLGTVYPQFICIGSSPYRAALFPTDLTCQTVMDGPRLRILKGAKPGDLPVQLASKFEFVVNLKTWFPPKGSARLTTGRLFHGARAAAQITATQIAAVIANPIQIE